MSLERRNVIFHIDVNSAFLSWEATYRLHHLGGKEDLREKVSAVVPYKNGRNYSGGETEMSGVDFGSTQL